jgi:signal transduction histidine kinase
VRRRVVQSTLAVVVVALALLGVPLGVAGVMTASAMEQRDVDRVASTVGAAVERRLEAGEPVTGAVLERLPEDAYAVVRVNGVVAVQQGGPQSRPVQAEFQSATTSVYVEQSGLDLLAAQVRIVLLVLTAAVVAVAAAVVLGVFQARRFAAPLDDLAARARRLGSGDTRASFPRYEIAEVDEVARALDTSAGRISSMLAAERQFAADASHQLRTPLTALSMRLEEILASDDPRAVREEASIALGQVERLSGVVDGLLAASRESRSGSAVPIEVDEVLSQQLAEWAPAFGAAARRLRLEGQRRLRAVASPGGLAQVVATLLENSLMHGAGPVTVSTRLMGVWVVVEVTDEGPGVPPELGSRVFERSVSGTSSTGLGLALARDLAEADGGRLELVRQRPPVFALFLGVAPDGPRPDDPGAGGSERPSGAAAGGRGAASRRARTVEGVRRAQAPARPPAAGSHAGSAASSGATAGNTQRR